MKTIIAAAVLVAACALATASTGAAATAPVITNTSISLVGQVYIEEAALFPCQGMEPIRITSGTLEIRNLRLTTESGVLVTTSHASYSNLSGIGQATGTTYTLHQLTNTARTGVVSDGRFESTIVSRLLIIATGPAAADAPDNGFMVSSVAKVVGEITSEGIIYNVEVSNSHIACP